MFFLIHLENDSISTNSTQIGIKEWFAPQISEHCPNRTDGLMAANDTWFNRPGIASTFTPRAGIVHE